MPEGSAHTYFAQLLLWAVPLTDPRYREAGCALRCLAGAEARLRMSGISRLCYGAACVLDAVVRRRFNYYLGETTARLAHINRLLAGEQPQWHAEPCAQAARERLQTASALQLRHRIPLPRDLFAAAAEN